jgi:adenylate cyclase
MYSQAGRPAEAISNANRALRLSPFDPGIFSAGARVSGAPTGALRRWSLAFRQGSASQSSNWWNYFFQAEALALAGRLEEARPILQRGLVLFPGYRIGMLAAFGASPAISDKVIEGARLLGVPE